MRFVKAVATFDQKVGLNQGLRPFAAMAGVESLALIEIGGWKVS